MKKKYVSPKAIQLTMTYETVYSKNVILQTIMIVVQASFSLSKGL